MLQFDVYVVFVRCSYRELHVMSAGGGGEKPYGGIELQNCRSTKTTLQRSVRCMYIPIVSVVEYTYLRAGE